MTVRRPKRAFDFIVVHVSLKAFHTSTLTNSPIIISRPRSSDVVSFALFRLSSQRRTKQQKKELLNTARQSQIEPSDQMSLSRNVCTFRSAPIVWLETKSVG
jgi:hypothetical protein